VPWTPLESSGGILHLDLIELVKEVRVMTETEERRFDKEEFRGRPEERVGETCEGIGDPIRRTLCRVCNTPVVGEAPFCKDHEPPVP
jgi:hypothetical protein